MKALLLVLAAALTLAGPATTQTAPSAELDPAVGRLLAELQQRIAEAPESAAAHGDFGVGAEANDLWETARDAYAVAARLDSENPDWHLHHAIALRETGDFAASLAAFSALVEAFPQHLPALQRLGAAQLDAGDTAGARATFMRLIQLDHELAQGHAGLGDALLREGDHQMAIEQLESALRLDPSYASAHYLLGQAYRAVGRLDEARRHLAFSENAQPRFLADSLTDRLASYAVNMTARLDQASASLARRQPERAIAILQSVLSDHPRNITVLNNLAVAFMHKGDLAAARQLLDQALEINDQKFSTYLNLAAWSQHSNNPEEALRFSSEAVARAPGVAQAHISRAGAFLRLGRIDDAIDSFRAALETDFREQEPYLALANLELRRGNAEISEGYSLRALGIWPELLPAHFLLFHASLELPDLDQARTALENARLLAPDHPSLAQLERLLREAEGRVE